MQYRRLGKTELSVSVMSFGAIRLPNLTQNETTALLKQAIDGGMNYIDTANCYGDSEVKVGEALRVLGNRADIIISSKVISREVDDFKSDFEVTLKNLQTEYLDILFIHDISTDANWKKVNENGIIDYMKQLKASGRVRHLACSTHDCGVGVKMLETDIFEVVMLAYNPSNLEIEDGIIDLAHKKDIGTVIMKPLGGGILSEERSPQLGFTITAKECLRFAAVHPYVDTVIPGLDKPEYVETAIEIGSGDLSMTEEEKQAIIGKISIKGKNYCRGCGYCMPCPKNIQIPTVLQLYNRWEIFDGIDWAQMHSIAGEYSANVKDTELPSECIACGACTKRCPFNLPIPELMKSASQEMTRY